MGKLVGGAALAVFLPIIIVVLAAGGMSTPNAAAGSAGALKPGAIPTQYIDVITRAAALCPLTTPALLAAQLHTESGFDPHASPAGIAGILPAEWHTYGRDDNGDGTADPHDPADAIPAMARIDCAADAAVASVPGDRTSLMLAAYNAGAGAVSQAGGVPPFPETQAYVNKVLALAAAYTQPAAVTAHGPGATLAGQWAPGVAATVNLIATKFHISAATYTNHHPDGGHAADLGYQQFGNDWTDGAPGIPGTGPQWQIATWIANNIVDTGNAWYVGHHASIHHYGDPPGLWRPINSQVGSTDPTYAHMNHIHLSWPPWYGQTGPDTFPSATNFSSPPQWTPGPLPAAGIPAASVALRVRRRRRNHAAARGQPDHSIKWGWTTGAVDRGVDPQGSSGLLLRATELPGRGAYEGPCRHVCEALCTDLPGLRGPVMIWQITFPRDTPRPYGLSNTDQLETAGMRRGAPPGLPRRSRSVADPTARARLTLTRSVIVSGRRCSTACGLTLSAWVEGLILRDDVDRFGRPRWAATPTGRLNYRSRTSDDPTQVLQLTLTHSTSATGRGRAIAAGLTFSGYIEALIRKELNQTTARPTPALEMTA